MAEPASTLPRYQIVAGRDQRQEAIGALGHALFITGIPAPAYDVAAVAVDHLEAQGYIITRPEQRG